jgi:hypothetical protein
MYHVPLRESGIWPGTNLKVNNFFSCTTSLPLKLIFSFMPLTYALVRLGWSMYWTQSPITKHGTRSRSILEISLRSSGESL